MQSKTKPLREPIGGETEPSQIAGTLVELMDGKVAAEDEVATVRNLLPVIELLTKDLGA